MRTGRDAQQAAEAAIEFDRGQIAAFKLVERARFARAARLAGVAGLTGVYFHVQDRAHRVNSDRSIARVCAFVYIRAAYLPLATVIDAHLSLCYISSAGSARATVRVATCPTGGVMENLVPHFIELIRRSATDLPADVEAALRRARSEEEDGSAAQTTLDSILQNVQLSRAQSTPICQDTGTPIFYVYYPTAWSTLALKRQIREAVAEATARSYLRPNSVDTLTGKNPGTNLGDDFPYFHFEEWEEDYLKVDLMLKGGGCENVGAQYSLPDSRLDANRDLEGVRRAVLDAVQQAQGMGCAPAVIGVAVGGDRGSSYIKSKEQFYRPLDDVNPDPKLAELEGRLTREANTLGIGPMGFGGKTTVLNVKIDSLERLPASYFVTASYMCWADRRRTLIYRDGLVTIE
jgi:fumarate hydratase, class I